MGDLRKATSVKGKDLYRQPFYSREMAFKFQPCNTPIVGTCIVFVVHYQLD